MKEHPLLLSASMVRATLAGRKTQTRRIMSKRNTLIDGKPWSKSKCKWDDIDISSPDLDGSSTGYCINHCYHEITPIYQPGDVVWFRETWQAYQGPAYGDGQSDEVFVYRADENPRDKQLIDDSGFIWRSSIHMPRRAARLVRPVVSSRIEYLQDITEEDAKAEGVMLVEGGLSPLESFIQLWGSINEDRDGGIYDWQANPLVIRIEFDPAKQLER